MSRVKKATAGKKATASKKATAGKHAREGTPWTDTEKSHVMFWEEDEQKRKNGLQETQGLTGYARAEADFGRTNMAFRLCMQKLRAAGDRRALILRTFKDQTKSQDPAALAFWQAAFLALPESPTLAAPPSVSPAVPTFAAPPSLLPAVSTTPVPSHTSSPPSLPGSSYSSPPPRSPSPVLMAVTKTPAIAPCMPPQHSTPPPDLSRSVSSASSHSSVRGDSTGSESSSTERQFSFRPTTKLWHWSHLERFSSEILVKTEGALALLHLHSAGESKPSQDQVFRALVEADSRC